MFQFPWYASTQPMYSVVSNWILPQLGFPIRTSPDQSLLTAPRGSFVVRHVLHRLLAPRHPPCALSSLTIALVFELSLRLVCLRKSKVAPFRSLAPAIYLIYTSLVDTRSARMIVVRLLEPSHHSSLKECSNSRLFRFDI